jgi:hypothetical protein
MGLIDEELQRKHAIEERLLNFARFVMAQKAKNSRGMGKAALMSEGYRDFYGEVTFGLGMYRSLWILPTDKNPKVLIFADRKEAKEHAKKLQKILRGNGYPFSKAWVEPVAVRSSKPHPYSGFILPTISYEEKFIIRMKVR